MTEASAPGKLILCGEHAVVYGRPAIALPLGDVRARATVSAGPPGSGITCAAADLGQSWTLADEPDNPFSELIARLLEPLTPHAAPDLRITISSAIPIAGGMGSGAAIATAITRALAAHLGRDLPPDVISTLVYTSEQRFHGTPSGIDNTVIAYERPIWYVRSPSDAGHGGSNEAPAQAEIAPVVIAAPFTLLIGDTGVRSPTRLPVGEVRQRWLADPPHYEAIFDAIAGVVTDTRSALAAGDLGALGPLLDANQALLAQLGVSSPELDRLIAAARAAGAAGAKLSGAGWGGVMLALATAATQERIAAALSRAGAARVLATTVAPNLIACE
jgi:mevalonate kinase